MKLPDIQYGGTPTANAPSPQQAVDVYSQKQALLQKAAGAAQEIAIASSEYNVTKADNAYADEMAAFRKESAKLDRLTPGQVKALDIDVDTEGKEYIPKIEWYPKLLAKRMEEYRGKHAATIRSNVDRQKWDAEVRRNDDKILEREIELAAAESRKSIAVQAAIDADNAYTAGHWDSARTALKAAENAYKSTPEGTAQYEAKLDAIDLAEGQEIIRDEVDAIGDNPDALRAYAASLKSDDAHQKYPLNPNQLAAESDRLESLATVKENEAEKKKNKDSAERLTTYFHKYRDDPAGMVANITPDMSIDEVKALESYAHAKSKPAEIKTDINVYRKLKNMAMLDSEKFASDPKYNPALYGSKLDQADYDELMELYINALKGDVSYQTDLRTSTQLRTNALRILGVDEKKDPEKAYLFDKVAQEAVYAREKAIGRSLDGLEKAAIYKDLTRNAQGDKTWWSGVAGKFGAKPSYEEQDIFEVLGSIDATDDEISNATRVLTERGVPITSLSIKGTIENHRTKLAAQR